jgi:hypothetical protein
MAQSKNLTDVSLVSRKNDDHWRLPVSGQAVALVRLHVLALGEHRVPRQDALELAHEA